MNLDMSNWFPCVVIPHGLHMMCCLLCCLLSSCIVSAMEWAFNYYDNTYSVQLSLEAVTHHFEICTWNCSTHKVHWQLYSVAVLFYSNFKLCFTNCKVCVNFTTQLYLLYFVDRLWNKNYMRRKKHFFRRKTEMIKWVIDEW